jgi:Ion channel.
MGGAKKYFNFFLPFGHLFKDRQYRALILITISVLVGGTIFYHSMEGWGWIDSLYFCVISLTTVGYGDLTPKRPISKIFTMFYLLGGISILLGFINAIAAHRGKYLGGDEGKPND